MRKQTLILPLILLALALIPLTPAAAQPRQQNAGSEPAHIVLTLDNGADARMNRVDWDVNAWSPLLPGASLRSSDYIDLAGRTTVRVLCTDLSLLDQRGSEVPRCNPYPAVTAFYYYDDPAWTMRDQTPTVFTLPAGVSTLAPGFDPGAFGASELSGGQLDTVLAGIQAIQSLDVPADAQALALASLYRTNDLVLDALGVLLALPDLGCVQRPAVAVPDGEARPMVQSPVMYLRIGELYEMLGSLNDAARNYQCAADLADSLGDPADAALAYTRWANVAPDPGQAIQFYQFSITNYGTIGALDQMNTVLEICGSRNCTTP
ncbi:MAG: hypothetical protein HY866_18230 [Chloroflexi bacterium]|nr:hypothetical protein [Chloroflexota bacterium]